MLESLGTGTQSDENNALDINYLLHFNCIVQLASLGGGLWGRGSSTQPGSW